MMEPGSKAVTGLSGAEHAFHAIMFVFTAGLWGIVWIKRAIGQRRVTRFK